jgi:hypothetical protein
MCCTLNEYLLFQPQRFKINRKLLPRGVSSRSHSQTGKIYVGSDTAKTAKLDFFKYFGTPTTAKQHRLIEMVECLSGEQPYIVNKEILHSEEKVDIR